MRKGPNPTATWKHPAPLRRPLISAVVPIYNEADGIALLYARLCAVFEQDFPSFEIVFIDDGSKDDSCRQLEELVERDSRVVLVKLSRNYGKEIALSAGLDFTSGEYVVPLDADLQDPPEVVKELYDRIQEGFDVVYGVRRSRQGESPPKRWTATWFYRVIGRLSDVPIPADTGDFRLVRREVILSMRSLHERNRFMKGLFAWVGFRQTGHYYDRDPRQFGTTKWNYWKLWNFALEGITSFSQTPLKVATYVGLAVSGCAFGLGAFYAAKYLLFGDQVRGFTTTIVTQFFLGGVQLVFLGLIGEYVGRIYSEAKNRPLYIAEAFQGGTTGQHRRLVIRERSGVRECPDDGYAPAMT